MVTLPEPPMFVAVEAMIVGGGTVVTVVGSPTTGLEALLMVALPISTVDEPWPLVDGTIGASMMRWS